MNVPDATTSGPARLSGGRAESRARAWETFYAYCFEVVNRCAAVNRLRGADREDCVQDVMTEIVRKFGADLPEGADVDVDRWIQVVSRNKAADIWRRRYRRAEVPIDEEALGRPLAPEASAAGEDEGESVSLVWEALVSLDGEVTVTSYLIFYLRAIEGWSVPEIAELFQLTPEQTRARCHRVKRRFEALLKERFPALAERDEG